jgi:hypothetical protein
MHVSTKTPESFGFLTSRSLVCRSAPGNNLGLAIGSPSAGRWRSGQTPANRRPGPAGRGQRVIYEVPRLDFNRKVRGGGGAGGVVWRRRPVSAAVPPAPASSRPGQVDGRYE